MEQPGSQVCGRCGMINAANVRFCPRCGNILSSNVYPQTQPSSPSSQPSQASSQAGVAVTGRSQQPGNPYPFYSDSASTFYGGSASDTMKTDGTALNPYEQRPADYRVVPPPPPPPKSRKQTRRRFIIGGIGGVVAVAVAGTGAYFAVSHNQSTPPLAMLTLNFNYSTEKQAWMEEVIPAFNNSRTISNGKVINVVGIPSPSVATQQGLLNKSLSPMPHIWSPASDLELQQLSNSWQQKHGSQNILVDQSQSLVLSPLVFAVWQDRAATLLGHYGSIDWSSVHDALTQPGWSSIGGQSTWQSVKFGQTRPDMSNSGLLTLTLMAYSFYNKTRDLKVTDIDAASFQSYLNDIESAVQKFGKSSGHYLENEVILNGPSAYDIVTTYENLVVTDQQLAQSRGGEPLQPYYPSLNIVSNHPFAILSGDWITSEEQLAAKAFRDFLLGDAAQKKALLKGFRPVNISDPVEDKTPGNPFQSQVVQPFLSSIPRRLPPQVQPPNGNVVDEIISQWQQKYGNYPTADY